ncbi:MAG: CDP-alcohol phosphatidyltransferase family protein [Planctomycetes bacterium]|nr:CDP-alcohol phosphatidyltransferase family protein [Planctomycetota bacterium]
MNWKLPNQLTMARLVLSAVFFVLLANCDVKRDSAGMLLACFVVYIIAGVTDVLDGYLARKWAITSSFGRIADPIVDKVIVCGAFALLAGRNFAFGEVGALDEFQRRLPYWLHGGMASGVQSWMVVILVAREFIISGIRGFSEGRGVTFAATSAGKIKMFIQSLAICAVILQLAFFTNAAWAVAVKLTVVWLMVVVTVASGLAYVRRARGVLAGDGCE